MKGFTNYFVAVAAILFLLAGAGCASLPPAAPAAETAGEERVALPEIAEIFLKNDYRQLRGLLSPELREQLSREAFEAMLAEAAGTGRLTGVDYLGELCHPVIGSEIWRLRSVKTADGKELTFDRLLRVMTAPLDGKPRIVGLMLL